MQAKKHVNADGFGAIEPSYNQQYKTWVAEQKEAGNTDVMLFHDWANTVKKPSLNAGGVVDNTKLQNVADTLATLGTDLIGSLTKKGEAGTTTDTADAAKIAADKAAADKAAADALAKKDATPAFLGVPNPVWGVIIIGVVGVAGYYMIKAISGSGTTGEASAPAAK